jgi:cyclic nucleotide-binding protein
MSQAREVTWRQAAAGVTAPRESQSALPVRVVPPEPPGTRPAFSAAQVERLVRYGAEEVVRPDDLVFADGDVGYDLVLILEGCVEVVECYGTLEEVAISRYGPGEFPGEISLLTGQRVFLTAVVRESGRVVRVPTTRPRDHRTGARPQRTDPAGATGSPCSVDHARRGPDLDRLALPTGHAASAQCVGAQPALLAVARSRRFG